VKILKHYLKILKFVVSTVRILTNGVFAISDVDKKINFWIFNFLYVNNNYLIRKEIFIRNIVKKLENKFISYKCKT
jgi:hypothetical protein